MAEKVTIAELNIDIDAVLKDGATYLKLIDQIKDQQKSLDRSTEQGAESYAKLDAQLKNVQTQYRDNRKLAQTLISVNKDLNGTLSAQGKTTNELIRDRGKLQALSKNVRGDTKEEREIRQRLNDAIDEQTKALREQSSEYITGKDSVGEYRQAIEGAIGSNTLLGKTIVGIKSSLEVVTPVYNAFTAQVRSGVSEIRNAAKDTEGLTNAQKRSAIASNIFSGALKILRAALISTGIGAIVVLLGSLVAFLGSTQKGIDKVNQVLKPFQVILQRLFGILQNVGEELFNAFSNPRQLISDLGESIKRNLEVRFEAVSRIIERIVNFDFAGIGEDLSQAATGVENIGEKTRNFFGQARDFLKESIALGQELADLQVEIEKGEIRLVTAQAELTREIKAQNLVAEDITKSLAEREAAAKASLEANQELLRLEQEQLDKKIQQAEIEQSLNDTSRKDELELAQLKAQRIEAETRALELQTTQNNKLNQIRREEATAAKQFSQEREKAAREAAAEAVKNAQIELEIYKETNRDKLAADGELNQARIEAALAAEMFIKDSRLAILDEQLSSGLTSEREAALERLKIQSDFNDRRKELEDEFKAQQAEDLKEENERQSERAAIELEAERELRLLKAEDERAFRLERLEQQRQDEIAAAEAVGASTVAIEQRYAELRNRIENAVAMNKLAAISGALGGAAALLRENTSLAKTLGIAQATIDTYIGANKALATLPPPFGAIQAGITIAAGLQNVARIGGVKFERGGLQEIGGKRHSAGGTKFAGEDGTTFEAERGELIGVMSRPAAKAFMRFNNMFTRGSSRSGFYQGGGVFGASGGAVQSSFRSGGSLGQNIEGIDYNKLAMAVKEGYQSASPPQVSVEEFREVEGSMLQVQTSANV